MVPCNHWNNDLFTRVPPFSNDNRPFNSPLCIFVPPSRDRHVFPIQNCVGVGYERFVVSIFVVSRKAVIFANRLSNDRRACFGNNSRREIFSLFFRDSQSWIHLNPSTRFSYSGPSGGSISQRSNSKPSNFQTLRAISNDLGIGQLTWCSETMRDGSWIPAADYVFTGED